MDLPLKDIKNYLFVTQDGNYEDKLYKLCFQMVKSGQVVLLFTRSSDYNLLPLVKEFQLDRLAAKECLKRLIIMSFTSLEGITRKLLELHDWVILPALVIVDLYPIVALHHQQQIESEQTIAIDVPTTVPFFQSLCFCIATLFNYMESVQSQIQNKPTGSLVKANELKINSISSVIVLQEHEELLKKVQIQLLFNLYYYNDNAFGEFAEVQSHIRNNFKN